MYVRVCVYVGKDALSSHMKPNCWVVDGHVFRVIQPYFNIICESESKYF